MTVYIPHSGEAPTPWTNAWARTYAKDACKLPCIRHDDYGRYIAMLWDKAEPFILVEHDVVPWPGAVESLQACPEPWCVFAYEAGTEFNGDGIPLGCVKFDPVTLGPCPLEPLPGGEYPHWGSLDGQISSTFLTRNIYPHQHTPAVAHIKLLRSVVFIGG